jgi:6-pyruvoyltetrahydropterin/6-carboxytetrahydropterin synthase
MVLDFKEVKDRVSDLCDSLDHTILIPTSSPTLKIVENEGQIEVRSAGKFYSFPKEDCKLLPIKATTAEELARHVYMELKKTLPLLKKAYVSESEGSIAFYSED